MGLLEKSAILTLAAGLTLASGGCEKSRNEMRPDMDKVVSNAHGLQSRDLREMTDKMAADILQIDEIKRNPNKITVVVMPIKNGLEGEQSKNLDIYVKRLSGLLNSSAARSSIAFVENNATVEKMAAQEGVGSGGGDSFGEGGRPGTAPPPSPRVLPQFALYGEFYSMNDGKTTYYLCQFKLTNFATHVEVWTNQYETRTLNVN